MLDMNKILLIVLVSLCSFSISAKENVSNGNSTTISNSSLARVAADCVPSQAKTDLNINNVRTTIMGGGDMWWNLTDARYEIPKDGNKHSMFAGALWIAGIDAGEQLKAAAMTYRQTGNDFWTGPLDEFSEITPHADLITSVLCSMQTIVCPLLIRALKDFKSLLIS